MAVAWDVPTGQQLWQRQSQSRSFLNFVPLSADATVVAEPGDKALNLREIATGRHLLSLELTGLRRGEGLWYEVAAFAPDGRTVAAATSLLVPRGGRIEQNESSIYLWEVATGKLIRRIVGIKSPLSAAAFAPDGRTLATAGQGLVQLWDVATGRELLTDRGQDPCAYLGAIDFSPDGTRLAVGYHDSTTLIWDMTPGIRRAGMAAQDLSPDRLDQLWSELAAADAAQGQAALWTLVAAPEEALRLLSDRLKPAEPVDIGHVRRLVAALDSPNSATREAASRELEQLADWAELLLRQAIAEGPSPEARHRIDAILSGPRVVRVPDVLRGIRAVQVLEQIGTPDARKRLAELARGDPTARLTREARASLERLRRPD
jgi:hypothetical protein